LGYGERINNFARSSKYGISRHRRGKVDILADVLNAARDGARSTHIMYKANLNFHQRKKYLAGAINSGLIGVRVNPPLMYVTTEKGYKWLEEYRKLLKSSGTFAT
jgi:predicted transcriptional regulator